jgi:uncharacterized protein YndB with AHSA1/START domain
MFINESMVTPLEICFSHCDTSAPGPPGRVLPPDQRDLDDVLGERRSVRTSRQGSAEVDADLERQRGELRAIIHAWIQMKVFAGAWPEGSTRPTLAVSAMEALMATQGDFTITIDAPPAVVWQWVGDMSKHPQFSPHDYTVEQISGEPNAVGSKYRSVGWVPGDKAHKNEFEIVASVPDSRLVIRADDAQGAFMNTFTLTPVGKGTRVDYQLVFPKMTGMSAVLVPILFPLVGKSDIRKRMEMLKTMAESAP